MKCPKCGKETVMIPSWRRCPKCGYDILEKTDEDREREKRLDELIKKELENNRLKL